ncbi:hypothetical protein RhiirA5_413987 [Rhizophagus irregularis]|uniref:Ricin B lectin domain-containing protein n=2 Tax=Rhizophagus irregularis TaxID=588596 RepID=A0A2I1E6S7_9GLOM|nr:hypothetical protein RirG_255140 [Rhizophagus irregularis DAOM 197198w]PKC10739.1 hypothetical protein RhiirA5_413987 [Rhizophagus irregularis]GBC28516.1 hypothetical protein RIR_jg10582.t1 [Rhizophagus irregularis DAOM 181602=DAOM 197198]PKC72258.1 hypothetical protein RhiirA1_452533 [Rhizophagus irregularis]PKY17835.1 hypothetical protein RhiirB3_382839 [Rhizophagus irregularis]
MKFNLFLLLLATLLAVGSPQGISYRFQVQEGNSNRFWVATGKQIGLRENFGDWWIALTGDQKNYKISHSKSGLVVTYVAGKALSLTSNSPLSQFQLWQFFPPNLEHLDPIVSIRTSNFKDEYAFPGPIGVYIFACNSTTNSTVSHPIWKFKSHVPTSTP